MKTLTKAAIAGGALATALVLLALTADRRVSGPDVESSAIPLPTITPSATTSGARPGFLYGRVTTLNGTSYEGRLRWGRAEEAFWGNFFNGVKDENPWATYASPEQLKERRPVKVFGFEITSRESDIDLDRPFMARFGDIARIEATGLDVQVTLKSGTLFTLDRLSASDFDDGVRVWDDRRGAVDLDSLQIRTIDFLPTGQLDTTPSRLHATVQTATGDFTGFIQWNREACVGSDQFHGQADDGQLHLRFDSIRAIARQSLESALVTLIDGREIKLSGTRDVGPRNRGIYVDDPRYGRVLISWEAFERIDFSAAGSGPAYDDFPPGHSLTGSITTRTGRRLAGRLIFDLDESETTETLDAPWQGVDYTIPFGLISSIVLPGREKHGAPSASLTLHGGEELQLELGGDLGEGNAGLLVFADDRQRPAYVPWSEIQQVDFDRPPAISPLMGEN